MITRDTAELLQGHCHTGQGPPSGVQRGTLNGCISRTWPQGQQSVREATCDVSGPGLGQRGQWGAPCAHGQCGRRTTENRRSAARCHKAWRTKRRILSFWLKTELITTWAASPRRQSPDRNRTPGPAPPIISYKVSDLSMHMHSWETHPPTPPCDRGHLTDSRHPRLSRPSRRFCSRKSQRSRAASAPPLASRPVSHGPPAATPAVGYSEVDPRGNVVSSQAFQKFSLNAEEFT